MGRKTQKYDPKQLFLAGLLSFGNSAIFAGWTKPHYTRLQDMKRRKSHAKFKAQCAARRAQRRAAA